MGLEQIRLLKQQALLPKEKKMYFLPKVSKKKQVQIKEQKLSNTDKKEDDFFEYHMKHSVPVCAECGMTANWLLEPQQDHQKAEAYKLIWRACQAHILPKKKNYGFPSLRNHLDNHLVLFPSWGGTLCGCHGFYDSNWYNASTMKIWPKVIEAFIKLYPSIPKIEHKNIPDILLA